MWRIERRPWSDGFTRLMAGAMQAASTIVSRLKSQNDRKEQSRTQAPPDDSPIGASVTIGLRDRTLDHKIRPDTLHDLATDDDSASPAAPEQESASVIPTVGAILESTETSVRLGNCVANNREVFESWLIENAIEERENFIGDIRSRCASLGRKTADEALEILERYAVSPWPLGATEEGEQAEEQGPSAPFLSESIVSVLARHEMSTRLENVVKAGALDGTTMRDVVSDPYSVKKLFLELKNSGRKTADEAMGILFNYAERMNVSQETPDSPATMTCREFFQSGPHVNIPARIDPKDSVAGSLLRIGDGEEAAKRLRWLMDSPREWVGEIIGSSLLDEKERRVLTARYGLNGATKSTLQGIATDVNVTRERVRQVEAKGLKHLRHSHESRAAFQTLVIREQNSAWVALSNDSPMIDADHVREGMKRVDPLYVLAIDVIYGNVKAWLDSIAHGSSKGWFRSEAEASRGLHESGEVLAIMRDHAMPMPISTAEQILGRKLADFELVGGHGWRVFEGFLHSGYLGPKARRIMRMHSVARGCSRDGLFDIGTLTKSYREQFHDDDCGSRIFKMQADAAPHLFAPLFDNIWLRLPQEVAPSSSVGALPFERRNASDNEFSEDSIGDLISRRLAVDGPQRLVDLRECVTTDTENEVMNSSVGAVLLSNPCFQRVAPGYFALYRGEQELRDKLHPRLLEERHCRVYCLARHGGAPSDYYPGWGPEFEMKLSVWAQRSAPTELFRSLMSVIEPEHWPIQEEMLTQFQETKTREARWLLGSEPRPLGHRFMDPEQFFSGPGAFGLVRLDQLVRRKSRIRL